MKISHILIWITLLFLFPLTIFGQTLLSGHVYDQKTNQPIPFVNIQVKGKERKGTTTDVRGLFRLDPFVDNEVLIISHVGYFPQEITLQALKSRPDIFLVPMAVELGEVQILAGENPALPIIRKAIANKDLNNPDKLDSYRFTSYNKMVMTLDGLNEQPEVDDTTVNFLKGGHIFMTESFSEVVFKKPGKRNETVKASKMSGIENPLVAMASSSFQPFSFYTDHIKILEVPYVNPLSNDGLRKYDYFLEDSIQNEIGTSYIISYQPIEGKVYQLGKGLMYISSLQYALENMVIKPSDPDTNLLFELQQKNRWDGKNWFPEQLNSIYLAPEMEFEGKAFKITNQTFLSDVQINELDRSTKFGPIALNFAIQNDLYDWGNLRLDSLTSREYLTYVRFDNMPEKDKRRLNMASKLLTQLSSGRIPLGPVDLIPNRVLRFNRFESVGLGLGLSSNETLSDVVRFEGYFRYGFRDKGWKYGAGTELRLDKKYDSKLLFYYSQDISEPGKTLLPKTNSFSSTGNIFRNFLADRMDEVERYSVEFSQMPLKGVKLGFFGSVENRANVLNYATGVPSDDFPRVFTATETGIDFRFVGGESVSRIGNNLVSWTMSYPVVSLRASKAIPDAIGGNVDFWNTEFKFQHQWSSGNSLNQFHLSAHGIWGDNLPISYLNTGYGINVGQRNALDFALSFPGYLQTMFLYEFLSDRSMHASYSHQTGPLFYKKAGKAIFAPQLKFHQSFAIGSLSNPEFYDFVDFKTMEKGYLESGIELNNILKQKSGLQYRGWGLGAFYRYGPYANPTFKENLTITLSITASF
ncbi:DUF5686 and carboxypeptidase-like regulatory domain-containing protein [Cognataquiflexum aquatile]|uniref:DUF5686 and carboxypeptidase-like regulatory domain-containing protein n=1 Tax=Cognataquiflexum aquatile TaxID=2249427 RepID=UPI000DEA6E7D|nr:DUF5686 and carboxypeptidase-like regulatory domain-containing protein [Cognataquiflexum aquatile]